MARDPKGGMTVKEAGRKGGAKVAAERGSEFFAAIGRKGGQSVSQDRDHMARIGKKGGERRGVNAPRRGGSTSS
jgi:hypothetical protein